MVAVSAVWQTTCTCVRAGEEGFVIDSPVLPGELEALPSVLDQAGFPVSGLLATHGDWDHLLARLAFPETSLGVGESTARRLAAEMGGAQRDLRAFDEEHYVVRQRPLALAAVQELPVPGRLGLGSVELELHEAGGHTVDGVALWLPWCSVLVCGDYLSPVEIPMVEGSADEYVATLGRLAPLVEQAASVVPGHGAPLSRSEALRILEADRVYVQALVDGGPPALPEGRRTAHQRSIHAANLARAGRG